MGRGTRFKGYLTVMIFIEIVVGVWNVLPEEVVEAPTVTTAERHLNRCLEKTGQRGISS